MAIVLDGTANTVTPLNGALGATTPSTVVATSVNTPNTFGFKNRIINGAMVIDQRNAGASITQNTSATQFSVDRWKIYGSAASKFTAQQNGGAITAPAGFSNYLGLTSTSAYSITSTSSFALYQSIEGYNIADLNWGTANAQAVTLSFKVYSSLTGTFGGSITNSAQNYSYPFSYSIPVANTWTTISVSVSAPTAGTWLGTTNEGLILWFGLGIGSTLSGTAGSWSANGYYSATGATSVVGTSGATFYITGVQLEKGSTATSFDVRDYGRELIMCQRYYWKGANSIWGSWYAGGGSIMLTINNPVPMRANPSYTKSGTLAFYSYTIADATNITYSAIYEQSVNSAQVLFTTTGAGASAVGLPGYTYSSGYINVSAEL